MMKKCISLLLSIVLVIACFSVAVAQDEVTVTFSFNKVKGAKGDVVYVDFSILEENTYTTNFSVKFGYDVETVEFIEHPESKKWFTPGPAFTFENDPEQCMDPMSYFFDKENMTLHAAEPTSLGAAGVMGTLAFRLLKDLPNEQPIVACLVKVPPAYYPDLIPVDSVVIENNLELFDFSSFAPNGMKGNHLTFSLPSLTARKNNIVFLDFKLQETYSYIGEFEVEFSFDKSQFQLVKNPETGKIFTPNEELEGSEISFDETTGRLRFSNPNGLIKNGTIGTLALKVLDIYAPGIAVPITVTFIEEPKHSQQSDFVYEVSVEQGEILLYASIFTFQITKEGAILVSYMGNESRIEIPRFYEGVPVVGIGEKAFENCTALKQITILDQITQIAENAFDGCNNLLYIVCGRGSAAEQLAIKRDFLYTNCVMAETVTATDVLAPGDLNGDTIINAKDALIVLQMGVLKYPFTPEQEKAADVTGNGKIDAKDALEILKKSVWKPACF